MSRRHSAGGEAFEVALPAGWDEVALAVFLHGGDSKQLPEPQPGSRPIAARPLPGDAARRLPAEARRQGRRSAEL